jgi:uncharacterized protein with von Willebrand factor type A (vWA) domain
MKPLNKTANDLFQNLRTQFSPVTIGNDNAEITSDPTEARFFTFEYTEKNKSVGTVSISIIDNRSLKVYFNHDMVENITSPNRWYSFLKDLRFFAKQNMLTFDARDIQKDRLDSRDFDFIKQNDGPYKEEDVEITESKMYGSKRKSKQQFENATLIVYHKKTVDEEVRGSRSRHIDSIFIESNGEKFRFPINYLNGARAMTVHVSEGGTPYDNIGQHIIETVKEMRNLSQFARITRKHAMEDEEASNIRNRVVEAYQSIRKDIMRMQNVNNYKQFAESFKPNETTTASDVAQLQEKFTVKVWNKKMDDLLPSVQRALESSNEQQEAMSAPDYNPAAGKYSSNMEYGMFTPQGNEEVEEIVQAACDMVKTGKHDVMSATDAAMNMLTDLAEASPHDEAEDTEVRENVAREIGSRCDNMNEEEVDENAFNQAAADAARKGDSHFTFNGKKYKTKMDKDTAHKLDEASPSVEKTIKDPNFVLVLKKDEAADGMLRRTQFKTAQGLLAFAMADIASRIIGSNSDAVANFASDMMINVGEEGETFGTKMTPEYKRDKQLAMMLAKRYIDDVKRIATDEEYAKEVRKDPDDVYGKKKKRSGGFHEAFENWANEIVEAGTTGTVGTSGTVPARVNQQVVKAMAGGDAQATQQVKRIGDKLAKGQKLTPAEMPVAGEIAKKLMTTKKTSAAMQALANSETNELKDGEVAIAEKQLKVKADSDYDGDGKVESPRDEYMGSKDNAIKKAIKKKPTAEEIDDSEDDTLFQESLNLIKTYAGI